MMRQTSNIQTLSNLENFRSSTKFFSLGSPSFRKHLHFSELPSFPSFMLFLKATLLLFSCNCTVNWVQSSSETGPSPCSLHLYHFNFSQLANLSSPWCQGNEKVISSPTKCQLGMNARFLYLKILYLYVEFMYDHLSGLTTGHEGVWGKSATGIEYLQQYHSRQRRFLSRHEMQS